MTTIAVAKQIKKEKQIKATPTTKNSHHKKYQNTPKMKNKSKTYKHYPLQELSQKHH